MNQVNRLPQGGRIDRTRPLRFVFDGRAYQGYEGDTLASALLANGVGWSAAVSSITARAASFLRRGGAERAGPAGQGAASEPNLRATRDRAL